MISLNMLPDVKLEYIKARRTQARVISLATLVTIGVVGLVVLLALWVYGGQTLQKAYLNGSIEKRARELKAIPDLNKYLTIQNQLANITKLHSDKNDFSRLFDFLPRLNPSAPNNVTLTNIDLVTNETDGSTLSLKGETKDYTALATFRDTLANARLHYDDGNGGKAEEALFTSVVVGSSALEKSTAGGEVVTFLIKLEYSPNAFLYSVKNTSVTVPAKTSTSSAEAAPNVFGKSSVDKEQQ